MKKITLFFFFWLLLQSVCIAQGTVIQDLHKEKGDTLISYSTGTKTIVDTLNFKRGCIIQKNDEYSEIYVINSTRKGYIIPVTTVYLSTSQLPLPLEFYSRTGRINVLNKNNFNSFFFNNHQVNVSIDWNSNVTFQSGRMIVVEGWDKNDSQVRKNLNYIKIQTVDNVTVLSKFTPEKAVYFNSKIELLAVGYNRNGTSIVPIVYNYGVSQNIAEQTFRSKELQPVELQAASPIAHRFNNANLSHTILFGNLNGTPTEEHGYEIVVLDTALNELHKVRTDSTQLLSSDGIIFPTNLFTVNDKIFVTGFIAYGNIQYPFYSEHSSNGEFVKSQIVNTNATIHSGSVFPDGKTVLMCGSILNANNNSDFFVVAINTETGSSTQKTWGDNRVNELFDILAISNDTAYVTGSEDKDFYAGRLVNLQTMSVGETNDFEKNIQVTPNPASNTISITVQNLRPTNSKLTIQSTQGQTVATVFEGVPNQTEMKNISIAHLPIGTYFVSMENGNNIFRAKFVVKR